MSSCRGYSWKKKHLLKYKSFFERELNELFTDKYFLDHIHDIYPKLAELNKSNLPMVWKIYCMGIDGIEGISFSMQLIPLKIRYYHLDSLKISSIHHSSCDHNRDLSVDSIILFIQCNQERVFNANSLPIFDSNAAMNLFERGNDCCRSCMIEITPKLVDITCKCVQGMINDDALNIDGFCMLCIWLANALKHNYIEHFFKADPEFYGLMLCVLYGVTATSDMLYRRHFDLYLNRLELITFSIFSLTRQIVINHKWLNKYYDHTKIGAESCMICGMVQWLMGQFHLFSEKKLIENQDQLPWKYDYFGAIIMLMTVASKECITEMIKITHHLDSIDFDPDTMDMLVPIWITTHQLTHRRTSVRKYFMSSLKQIDNKKKTLPKCQWKDCENKHADKYHKCKKCRVAKYCCRRHQKFDWNLGNHKRVCALYHQF